MNQSYIGTKVVLALAMNRLAYNAYRGWELPGDENGADDGYLVEYTDGGTPNHKEHAGYISWSPKEQFDNAYRSTEGMTFGLAIEAMKTGKRVARAGWNGKGMFLVFVPGSDVAPYPGTPYHDAKVIDDDGRVKINPHIDMKTATGEMQPGWLASQTDMLADDWQVVSE